MTGTYQNAGAQAQGAREKFIVFGNLKVLAASKSPDYDVCADKGRSENASCSCLVLPCAGREDCASRKRYLPMPETPLIIHPLVSSAVAIVGLIITWQQWGGVKRFYADA